MFDLNSINSFNIEELMKNYLNNLISKDPWAIGLGLVFLIFGSILTSIGSKLAWKGSNGALSLSWKTTKWFWNKIFPKVELSPLAKSILNVINTNSGVLSENTSYSTIRFGRSLCITVEYLPYTIQIDNITINDHLTKEELKLISNKVLPIFVTFKKNYKKEKLNHLITSIEENKPAEDNCSLETDTACKGTIVPELYNKNCVEAIKNNTDTPEKNDNYLCKLEQIIKRINESNKGIKEKLAELMATNNDIKEKIKTHYTEFPKSPESFEESVSYSFDSIPTPGWYLYDNSVNPARYTPCSKETQGRVIWIEKGICTSRENIINTEKQTGSKISLSKEISDAWDTYVNKEKTESRAVLMGWYQLIGGAFIWYSGYGNAICNKCIYYYDGHKLIDPINYVKL